MFTYHDDPSRVMPHVFKPHTMLTWDQLVAVRGWCLQQFGAPGIYEASRYSFSAKTVQAHGSDAFAFRDHADALHFRLRWC